MRLYRRLLRHYRPDAFAATRRDFMRQAAALGLMLVAGQTAAAMGLAPRARHGRRVIIVGAGFAGLACGYELKRAGYDVQLFEARGRVGGRVLTFRDWLPGKTIEAGGELIGSNHPMWVHYASLFGLGFRSLADWPEEADPILLDGTLLDEKQKRALFEEMDRILGALTDQSHAIDADRPWLSANAAALDGRNLADWITEQRPSGMTRSAMEAEFSSDNGVPLARQSLLGMMAAIKGGGLEKYWTDSEVCRCKQGNGRLAQEFAKAIGARHLHLKAPVTRIIRGTNSVDVMDAAGKHWQADHVVLTVPPSVWDKIAFDPPLPPDLAPQMGVQVKFLCRLREEVWRPASPNGLASDVINWTWDGTEGQAGPGGICLVGFSGGPSAIAAQRLYESGKERALIPALARLYPRLPGAFREGRFVDWPREPWTMAGYSCAAPGQITSIGRTHYDGIGRMQFAGEYSCFAFPGFMEGALQSGVRAARNIARADAAQID